MPIPGHSRTGSLGSWCPLAPDPPLLSGYAYFLRGRLYWKFDPVKVKALEGFPRLVGPDFFGCMELANTFR